MKRIICAVLALTLLGSTAAEARGWHGGYGGYRHGRGDVALGFGLGILALGIFAAAESGHDRDRYRERDDYYRDRDGRDDGAYRNDRGGPDDQDRAPPQHAYNHGDDNNNGNNNNDNDD